MFTGPAAARENWRGFGNGSGARNSTVLRLGFATAALRVIPNNCSTLLVNLLWTSPARDLVECDLGHFRFGVVNPRAPGIVGPDMSAGGRWQASSSGNLSRRIAPQRHNFAPNGMP